MSLKTPLRVCLLAGASSVALVAVAVTLSTPAVQADARLPRPASTAPPVPPVESSAPVILARQKASRESTHKKRADILHGLASWYGGVFNGRRTASGE